jgi:hypothetical protein
MNSPKEILIKQGQINEFKLLSFLEKYKYSTTIIIQELLNISFSGTHKFIKRMQEKEIINTYIIKKGISKIKIVGITIHGLHVLASFRYKKAPTSLDKNEKEKLLSINESNAFYLSKFSTTLFKHTLEIQKLHINLINKNIKINNHENIKKIIIPKDTINNVKNKIKNKQHEKYPDMIIELKNDKLIAVEVEITAKSIKRYNDIMVRYRKKINEETYESILYAYPNNLESIKNAILQSSRNHDIEEKIEFISLQNIDKTIKV